MEPHKTSTEGQVMGIIGIVLGIIALIVSFIPCVGAVALIPGGVAVIFSVISIMQASRANGGKALGVVSLVISGLAVIIAIAWLVFFGGVSSMASKSFKDSEVFDQIGKELKEVLKEIDEEYDSGRIDTLENVLRDLEEPSKEMHNNED